MTGNTGSLLGFIKRNKRAVAALILVALGIVMILAGTVDKVSETDGRDEHEARLEEMCSSLSGVGSCRVMITYKVTEGRYGAAGTKTVESVAVICKGADRAGVRKELTDMLTALYGIGANRIHISKMK